ncbi:RHS repeat-associated core domain-containing protein [Marinobacter sp.]|uniref:RHS repeat-associated core domain-containing protein n=1 Tax=Marinobacter sp. TaxID=50741 RepID=UPI00260E065C|nr:RHS repeat-associated core domain-containing protein [Marinobacter sp.]
MIIIALTDAAGQIAWEASYSPFGEALVTSQDPRFNLRFPGQYFDAETGLHYNWHRYYDPGTGRYITSDPIGILFIPG